MPIKFFQAPDCLVLKVTKEVMNNSVGCACKGSSSFAGIVTVVSRSEELTRADPNPCKDPGADVGR